ncbi:peptidase M16 [Phenylobacterium sp. Root77]|jgi:zinc protease|uniref:M16 family metallopeptidase n=1 Tax=unclassified Phenylobacterium TaxID=2640670 RepID=UPI0006F53562|nr:MULTISPECIES: pitrilysin family protein [unclassified Phenylobacterium]KQW69251.1 peptidase M16 [Phenylobacterium sp. Root1277]KQW95382.1 peptidase M16 [Phenylobacterium sp. Root1290]KRC41173.1 peptidase M16 [Phenylobacterium sp. Root77]
MLRHAAALAFTLCLGLALPAHAADAVPPIAYKERTLANGMKVFSAVDRTTPNVTVQVWYGVGSKDDPEGRSGFAHLFEHMMFKATRDMPSETIDRMTEDVGGFNNASTYDDFTNYYEVVPANHLQRLLWVEAQRLGSLVVDEATFKSERDVVKEELRQSVLSQPYGRLFYLYMPQASYQTHPYKRPGIGSIEELDAATIDDVRAFHAAYYRPDNAALIVVGNFDQAELDAWVDKYFGALKTPAAPIKRVTAVEPPRTAPGVFKGYGPNVPLPAILMTWHAPDAASPDAPALTVLDAILSSGKSSRLYDSLVYEQQVATEVFSDASLPQQPGLVMLGAILSGGKSIDDGQKALLAEVAKLRDAPPTDAELTEAKNELIAGKLRERETIDGRAFALGYALRTAGDAALANRELAELQAVTAADVQRVAQKYLTDAGRMTILYQPESARPAGETDAVAKPPVVASAKYSGPIVTLAPEGQRQAPPAVAEPVSPVLPKPADKTLANGLRVIVAKSSDLPLVSAALTVRAGAWADPQGLSGAMGMTAGMLTEGTKTRGAQEIASQTEALGAVLSSSGGQESSSVTLNVMPEKLPAAMAIMADVVKNPAFAAEELERQRVQALDGLSVAYQSPGQLAGFAASPVIFSGTSFGHVASGTPASLAKLSTGDLAALHGRYFRPDNAILVLTGDITPEQGFKLAEGAFGDWTAPAGAVPARAEVAPKAPPRAVAIDLPGTGQAAVTVAKAAISRGDPAYYPGVVANSVLGGGYSARLNQEIRIKRGLSYGANSRLSAMRTTGLFRAAAQTKNESAPQVLDLMLGELKRLADAPTGEDELKARKSVLVGGFGRELATTDGLAGILGGLALYDLPLSEVADYTGKVESVTAGEVQAFARDNLAPESVSVIVAGDAKAFADGLKQRRANLELVPAKDIDLDAVTLKK